MGTINGYGRPVVRISSAAPSGGGDSSDPGNDIIVTLPLTNSAGLTETYEIKKISHELINISGNTNEIVHAQKILGYIITFTLNYNRWITGRSLYEAVKKIFDAAKAGKRLFITPREDAPWREFEVLLANDTLELGLNKGGIKASSHRLPVLKFRSVRLEPDLKWFPPGYSQPGGGNVLPIEGEGSN